MCPSQGLKKGGPKEEKRTRQAGKYRFRLKQRHMEQRIYASVRWLSSKSQQTWNEPPFSSEPCSNSEPFQTSIDVLRTSAVGFTGLIYHGSLMLPDKALSIRQNTPNGLWALSTPITARGSASMVPDSLGERLFPRQWPRSCYRASGRPTAIAPGAQMARRSLSIDCGLRYHLCLVHGATCLTLNRA